MDILLILGIVIVIIGIIYAAYMVYWVNEINLYVIAQMDLLSRTLTYYYQTENIQPKSVNWGVDLVWNPNNEDIDGKRGFVTIWYGKDSGVDTPLKDITEADALGGEIIKTTEKFLKDKELKK